MTNRRHFLHTMAAAAAASLVPSSGVFGQGRVLDAIEIVQLDRIDS